MMKAVEDLDTYKICPVGKAMRGVEKIGRECAFACRFQVDPDGLICALSEVQTCSKRFNG